MKKTLKSISLIVLFVTFLGLNLNTIGKGIMINQSIAEEGGLFAPCYGQKEIGAGDWTFNYCPDYPIIYWCWIVYRQTPIWDGPKWICIYQHPPES